LPESDREAIQHFKERTAYWAKCIPRFPAVSAKPIFDNSFRICAHYVSWTTNKPGLHPYLTIDGPFFDRSYEKSCSIMKLTKTYEKYRHNQLQVIELSCEVHEQENIEELAYDDFEAMLIINGKKIADISYVLGAAGVFTMMVDEVDWHKQFDEQVHEWKPKPQLSLF
jgi:hypothetical protein